jgi:hypothetical protein
MRLRGDEQPARQIRLRREQLFLNIGLSRGEIGFGFATFPAECIRAYPSPAPRRFCRGIARRLQ